MFDCGAGRNYVVRSKKIKSNFIWHRNYIKYDGNVEMKPATSIIMELVKWCSFQEYPVTE